MSNFSIQIIYIDLRGPKYLRFPTKGAFLQSKLGLVRWVAFIFNSDLLINKSLQFDIGIYDNKF